ncbi:MAG TPA: sterol desaturase family protein [Polyangia bacterium]|nr:sterol desaturase family protein [Polyangia bacterium]
MGRHLGAFGALAVAAVGVASWLAASARLRDLWIVPAYLVAANVSEYLVHRLLMHRPLWPRTFYRNHTLGHHRAFHHDSMEIETWRELDLVMMPWFSLLLFFVGMAPVVAIVAWALGRGAAGLFLLTAVVSFVAYEGMHALYHFPAAVLERLRLRDNRVFRFLYEHHRHHHRLKRMRWTNFNISMPLCDCCFGTIENEARWLADRAARAQVTPVSDDAPDDGKHAA